MYDLLIKGAEVVDPSQQLHAPRDIGITAGKISTLESDIARNETKSVIDAPGKIVVPGLIDLHAHIPGGPDWRFSMPPDVVGVYAGVTTIVDAGSAGHANFERQRGFMVFSQTEVLNLLNIAAHGVSMETEIKEQASVNVEKTLQKAFENRNTIRGIKVRLFGENSKELGIEPIKTAKKIATQAGLPLMMHVALNPPEANSTGLREELTVCTQKALPLLDKGDIISHPYSQYGGVFKPDGSLMPELLEAINRGVNLDLGAGINSFSFGLAKKALDKGIIPTALSTDMTKGCVNSLGLYRLLELMSKFMALGLSLDKVVEMTTINPARILHEEERRGSLKVGMPADLSIIQVVEGDFMFWDRRNREYGNFFFSFPIEVEDGSSIKGRLRLVPRITIKAGAAVEADSSYCRLG